MNIQPPGPGPPGNICAACRLCGVLFDDLVDARDHFSTAPHPIRAKVRRELGPRELAQLVDARIQVMTVIDAAATAAWIKSVDAADVMERVVSNPSVFDDAANRSQIRDLAQTPARARRAVPVDRVPEPVPEPTVRYVVVVHVDGAKTYHFVAIPESTSTYYGLLGALERQLPGVDVGVLVTRRWAVAISSHEAREHIQIRNAADVVRAMAIRGHLVARKMIIG